MKVDRQTVLLTLILLVLCFLAYTFWPMASIIRKVVTEQENEEAEKARREAAFDRDRADREKDRVRRMSAEIVGGGLRRRTIRRRNIR